MLDGECGACRGDLGEVGVVVQAEFHWSGIRSVERGLGQVQGQAIEERMKGARHSDQVTSGGTRGLTKG
jgi:hypothetical protein